jgi:hypothetical protein
MGDLDGKRSKKFSGRMKKFFINARGDGNSVPSTRRNFP